MIFKNKINKPNHGKKKKKTFEQKGFSKPILNVPEFGHS